MSFLRGKKAERVVTKHPAITAGDSIDYINGGRKPQTLAYSQYVDSIERLNTCIRTTASIASGAKIEYRRDDSKGVSVKVQVKQFDGLFMNDYQSNSDFIREAIASLLTYDALYIVPEPGKGSRKGMIDYYILDPNKCKIVTGEPNSTIKEIIFTSSSGSETTYPYEDIIYVSTSMNSTNIVYAVSRIQSLVNTINNMLQTDEYVSAYLGSGGKNSTIVGYDAMLSEAQAGEIKREVNSFLRDVNPRALMINADKLNLSQISSGMSSAGVLDMVKYLSDSIQKAFGMPDFLLGQYTSGISETVLKDAARIWFQTNVKPLFTTLEEHFTRHLRNNLKLKDTYLRFNYEGINILEDSLKEKLDMVERMYKIGLISTNEGRNLLELERIDYEVADRRFLPAYLQGSSHVSIENYDEDIARVAQQDSPNNDIPNGDGGGNNTEGLNGAD